MTSFIKHDNQNPYNAYAISCDSLLISGDSKGEPGWAIPPQIFA